MAIAITLLALIVSLSALCALFLVHTHRGFQGELVDADLRYLSKQMQLDFAFEMEHGFRPDDIKSV